MLFEETRLSGVFLIRPERLEDERGFFARTFCRDEFRSRGLIADFVQSSISYNRVQGTLRGLHYQASPHAETKLVRCTLGAVHDVIVDLRKDSPTFMQWAAAELSAENRHSLYIPAGCAHGFLTLQDDTELHYDITPAYQHGSARGCRWNDPLLGIHWPAEVRIISERDRTLPDFHP